MNASLAAPKSASVGVLVEGQRQVAAVHLGVGVQPAGQVVVAVGAEADPRERIGDLGLRISVRQQGLR